MLKKIFISLIFILFLGNISALAVNDTKKPPVKPLMIEQNVDKNYKYGDFEKTFKNPMAEDNEFAKQPQRKVGSFLDILNTLVFIIFLVVVGILIFTKLNKTTVTELLSGKYKTSHNNKFKILSAHQLGDGKTIYLVEVNAKQIIIGTTQSKVDCIMPIDKSYSPEEIPEEYIEALFSGNSEDLKKLQE